MMKNKNKKFKTYKHGDLIQFWVIADGSEECIDGLVTCDQKDSVYVRFIHPIYPEAGWQYKSIYKSQILK
ncbi:MAG TPA: hypothetical protein V6C58_24625 [Allocoleopsis sp.]